MNFKYFFFLISEKFISINSKEINALKNSKNNTNKADINLKDWNFYVHDALGMFTFLMYENGYTVINFTIDVRFIFENPIFTFTFRRIIKIKIFFFNT